jgi:soluble lytic murein transglycosylase-like protein
MVRRLLACGLLLALLGCSKKRSGDAPPEEAAPSTPDSADAAVAPTDEEPPATTIGISWLPKTVDHWRDGLERLGATNNVDPELLAIIVLVESGGNPTAKSKSGALGLMQIIPLTGKHIATERKLPEQPKEKLTDPDYNLDFGAWYIGHQLLSFQVPGDRTRSIELAAAAYNGGPNKLKRHLNGAESLSNETQRYVKWVGGMWRERRKERSSTYAAWWSAGGERLIRDAGTKLEVPVTPPP